MRSSRGLLHLVTVCPHPHPITPAPTLLRLFWVEQRTFLGHPGRLTFMARIGGKWVDFKANRSWEVQGSLSLHAYFLIMVNRKCLWSNRCMSNICIHVTLMPWILKARLLQQEALCTQRVRQRYTEIKIALNQVCSFFLTKLVFCRKCFWNKRWNRSPSSVKINKSP